MKKPPYSAEQYSSRAPLTLPLDDRERTTRHVINVPVSTLYTERSSSRNTSDRYVHSIGSSTAVLSFDRPSHNYATRISHVEDSWSRGAEQPFGTSSYYQPRTATTGRSVAHSRPLSSNVIGTQYPAAATHLSRSSTSSLVGSYGYAVTQPLPNPSPLKSSGRRSLPYTADRI